MKKIIVSISIIFSIILVALLGLTACNSKQQRQEKLDKYVKEVSLQPKAKKQSVPKIKKYESIAYKPKKIRDPFLPLENTRSKKATSPHPDRTPEPLEALPIDSLYLVGTLHRGKKIWAVLLTPSNKIYHVAVGNYIGQNNGRITNITAGKVYVTESVPNSFDGWEQRELVMKLKSNKGNSHGQTN